MTFDLVQWLRGLSAGSSIPKKVFARLTLKIADPIARLLGANHSVRATVYGRSMLMPAEHSLPRTVAGFPQYNRPLSLAIEAIAATQTANISLAVIDVGANIGDTVAIIEQRLTGVCYYLCLEPDRNLADLCKLNHSDNPRINIEQCFIGEDEGAVVQLADDGRANPSTKLVDGAADPQNGGRLVRLDTIAMPFAETHGHVALIKVDTEGYDFSVLRSGSELLNKYHPCLFLEWYPELLLKLDEWPIDGFEFLKQLGYRHFVFFTKQGDYYCNISDPDRLFLRSLASIALEKFSQCYFDVFASTSQTVCDRLVESGISKELR